MRKQDKVTIEKSMERINLRAQVREAMVEAIENLDIDNMSTWDIALNIQNHLTDAGFEVVENSYKLVADFEPGNHAQKKNG